MLKQNDQSLLVKTQKMGGQFDNWSALFIQNDAFKCKAMSWNAFSRREIFKHISLFQTWESPKYLIWLLRSYLHIETEYRHILCGLKKAPCLIKFESIDLEITLTFSILKFFFQIFSKSHKWTCSLHPNSNVHLEVFKKHTFFRSVMLKAKTSFWFENWPTIYFPDLDLFQILRSGNNWMNPRTSLMRKSIQGVIQILFKGHNWI